MLKKILSIIKNNKIESIFVTSITLLILSVIIIYSFFPNLLAKQENINITSSNEETTTKSFKTSCNFDITYLSTWSYVTGPVCGGLKPLSIAEQDSTISNEYLILSFSRTELGSTLYEEDGTKVVIESLDDYIAYEKSYYDLNFIKDKTYGNNNGMNFQIDTEILLNYFIFVHDEYIYSAYWDDSNSDQDINAIENVLNSIKFTD